MTWDEAVRERTVRRFLECEEKRAEARDAALAEGKSEEEARELAREAAKQHWNAWAEIMLTKREKLEEGGAWAAEKNLFGSLEPKNAETLAWMEEAKASFSQCLFLPKRNEGTKEAPGDNKEGIEAVRLPIKSIEIEGKVTDFGEFVFPGDASFVGTTFGVASSFGGANFHGGARFYGATFENGGWFHCATFAGDTSFGSVTFNSDALFRSAIFKGDASFISTSFNGNASFDGATFTDEASFSSATLKGDAWFDGTTFKGCARFPAASFSGSTSFNRASFGSKALFVNATFNGTARFDDATFENYTQFDNASFEGYTWFNGATFESDTSFASAIFKGTASFTNSMIDIDEWRPTKFLGSTQFDSATFTKSASFRDAEFGAIEKKTDTDFTAIKVERAFDLSGACFSKVPSFCQADFKQAPDLDGVDFPLPEAEPFVSGDKDLIPKYRAIRRMAIQGADYDREQMAFKGELRSRRWMTDKPWHPGLWLGILYDVFADCGRSIFRPASIWLLSVFAFAVLYMRMAEGAWTCAAPFYKALFLSGRNALVLSSVGKDDRIAQAYKCVFGDTIPDGVSFVESFVQVPLSAVLIFLFLLAVKNRFKIK